MVNYSKSQIERYPKEVIVPLCYELSDENMEQVFDRCDIDAEDLRSMIRVLRRNLRNAKSDAKHLSSEYQNLQGEHKRLKNKVDISEWLNPLIEGASE